MADPLPTSLIRADTMSVERRFELLGRIGAGNHGVVFRARDSQLQREVAVKRFSHFLADDPRAMRRITREVATLARVSHPNVVTVHDLVQMPDGDGEITPHLVMELVEGRSLRDLLTSHGPSPRSVIVVRGVLEGLAACHHAGILHLDIKPANVLVTAEGGVKIVDFGIARAASDATATIAGTPHYMPPEQYEGRADQRSDIYSVGCLLFECLTGSPPFRGTMASQLLAHREQPRPDPRSLTPQVPAGMAAVVMRAMAIDPAHRYATVQDMLAALAAAPIHAAEPHAATPPPHTPRAVAGPQVSRSTRLRAYAVGLALSAFTVALVPGLVWLAAAFAPDRYRPDAMDPSTAGTWWMIAVSIATVLLLLRRRSFFEAIGGPAVGSLQPTRLVDAQMTRGIQMAAGSALRGSLPMLFPWYVALVAMCAATAGTAWPDDVFSMWGVAWLLMPPAAILLGIRGLTGLRPRFGAVLTSAVYLAGAALAIVLFIAYPLASS
ncbi:serine/threonine-protein kinase [Aeromicrobium sp.]|uniref:serine/threonine-protein kinase n=1 Tax=Aeromicrobium sp. TaxID=1871063 RepID=UPI0030C6288B